MRAPFVAGWFLVSGLAAQQPPPATDPKPEDLCIVEGKALNAATGEPLRKALVSLRFVGSPPWADVVMSSADGSFRFEKVRPGKYMLHARRSGFVPTSYGSHAGAWQGSTLTLRARDKSSGIEVKLKPHAVITGRILDEDGEPLQGARVQVLRTMYRDGRRQRVLANGASANDLGEYRIYGLAPGRYPLEASFTESSFGSSLGYGTVYYPNAPDPGSAVKVAVAAGQVLQGVDFTLRRVPTYTIRGRLSATRDTNVVVNDADNDSSMRRHVAMIHDGKFEVRGLPPGRYELTAFNSQRAEVAQSIITISNQDVDDVLLALEPTIEVRGRVRHEGQDDVAAVSVGGYSARVLLTTRRQAMFLGPPGGSLEPDGSFVLKNLAPGKYFVRMIATAPGLYVKQVRLGDTDVTTAGLDIGAGPPGELDILLGSDSGTITGTVEPAEGREPGGVMVVAQPEPQWRGQSRFVNAVTTSPDGSFELAGIPPGDYWLYAFEHLEPGAQDDAEFLEPFADKAKKITINPSGRETAALRSIPAELTGQDQP